MKMPPPKKTAAPPKKTGQGKRAHVKKTDSSSGTLKKAVKEKSAERPSPPVKKTKSAAGPSGRSAGKAAKPARVGRTGKRPLKSPEGATPAPAKTMSRMPAKKNALTKPSSKTSARKQLRKPASTPSPAPKPLARKAKSLKTGEMVPRPRAAAAAKAGRRELPREYGRNEVILMSVDPNVIFVDWEITKEEVPAGDIPVTMRVLDVTRDESPAAEGGDGFFDLRLDSRVGSGFFEIRMPGRQIAVEIGFYRGGHFSPVLRSEKVSMPELILPDDLGIAQKLFASGFPVGY